MFFRPCRDPTQCTKNLTCCTFAPPSLHAWQYPDHCIVIKYVPYVGDSKRAMDEYTSEMFMGGKSTIVMHNTCEDSLLAAPLILDLVILSELCQRITYRTDDTAEFEQFHSVLSILSYLLKAPLAIPGTPVVNSLFRQRACIENVLRACVGLKPNNQMRLDVMCPKFNPTDLATSKGSGSPSPGMQDSQQS